MENGNGSRKYLRDTRGKMDGDLLALQWMDHKNIFSQAIKGLRRKDAFTDATLACEGHFYPVHKFVLSTCSEYFSDIFDWTPCVNPVIVINNIISAELEVLLDFMYNGEVNIKENVLTNIIHAANCLKVRGLAVVEEDGQKSHLSAKPETTTTTTTSALSPTGTSTLVTSKTSSSTTLNGPPRKRSRCDVKRKSSSSASRSSTPTFRAPPPPRSGARIHTPSRPPTPARPSTPAHPSTPALPSTPGRLTPGALVSSLTPVPTIPTTVPSPPSVTTPPPPLISRIPSHTTATVVATTSTPIYSGGQILTPVLNSSLPTTVCHPVQLPPESQLHPAQLHTVSIGLQNQIAYPQIIVSQPQSQVIQQQGFVSQPINSYIVPTQAHTHINQSQTCGDGQNLIIDQHSPQPSSTQSLPVHTSHSQVSTHVNCTQYDLHPAGTNDIQVERHQQDKEVLISIQPQESKSEQPQPSPQAVESYDHVKDENIKMEFDEPSETPVVVNVSIPVHTSPPEISIPQMNPIDTLIEAVKMEEQDIVIRTDKGNVGIPEFLDSLEITAETSQNSEPNENLYEFTEVYPQTSTSSVPSASKTNLASHRMEQSPSYSQSSTSTSTTTEKPDFSCTVCEKIFKSREGLRRHSKTHQKNPFCCPKCSYSTMVFRDYTQHKETHAETKSCQHCDFTTKSMKEFTIHKRIHVEPMSCPLCEFSSKNMKDWVQHKKTHPEPHHCPCCDYKTSRLDLIKKHIQRHKEEDQHSCPHCTFSFSSRVLLGKHVKSAHGKSLMKDG